MHAVFNALPGLEVPVGGINDGLAKIWAESGTQDLRAMQLNLVLHLGQFTTPEDAEAQFRTTVEFARRYPCRVVVLSPERDPAAEKVFRAKIHAECFLGKSGRDTRCCEFVMLAYPAGTHDYLQNQVSTCLSTDLPLYYWAHRFSAARRLAAYDYLLTRSRRVLFDSAVVPADAFEFPWPNPAAVRDLAYTRTRQLRQIIGQFLSRYAPADIVNGLRVVKITHRAELGAEAAALLGWVKKGLLRCGADPEGGIDYIVAPEGCAGCFELGFGYHDPRKAFLWTADLGARTAEIEGDLGQGSTMLTASARLLEPAEALSEAMFH